MKLDAFKIIVSIFSVFLLLFISFRTYDYFNDPFKTEMTQKVSVNDAINVNALAVRREKLIESDKSGVMVYGVSNGTKVAKGAKIVEYFENEQSVAVKMQIDSLEQKIKQLTEISIQNQYYASDLDSVSSQIKGDMSMLLCAVDQNSFKKYSEYEQQLLYSMCRNALATKRTTDFDKQINEYKQQLELLKASLNSSVGSVETGYAGYFVNTVDGYESVVDYDKIAKLTVDEFDSIKSSEPSKSVIGRVVCDTEWYLAAKIPLDESHQIDLGDTLEVVLPLASAQTISVKVEALNIDYSKNSVLAVFSCLNMNEELVQIRNQQIQIIIEKYTGLRVNSKAVRIKDGQKGVYVSLGKLIKFRKVDISYSTEDFVIVKMNSKGTELKVYDDVIVRGSVLDE